ncbi:MAG: hypothetical protein SV686_17430 [Thermodesulfobacteriota bacterium]|nr:hypothetical protein [Thermodesulfobacteriota bacterium]
MKPGSSEKQITSPYKEKIVVVGFHAAISKGEKADVVRDPISGAIFEAEPVSDNHISQLTNMLFERLVAEKKYSLISPGQALGAYSSIVKSDKDVGADPVQLLQKVGMIFDADAVLAGYVYRRRERDGTGYGVKRPASVALDLHLLRPSDGVVLWMSKFDKTQRSLTENILDLSTFIKGKGRWMTAEELAAIGLDKLIMEMTSTGWKRKQ